MKNIIAIATLGLLMSCSQGSKTSIEEKRILLSELKSELRELESEIKGLTDEINKLDPPKEKPAVPVQEIIVKSNKFTRFVDVQGIVEADDIVNVSSEVGGRILKLYVKEGQYVNKGQLVATTDLSTLEKQIAEIQTRLDLASTVFERQKRLWDQGIGSEIQFLQAKSNKEGLEKSLETLNSQIVKKNIYAPISGYVDREFLQSGETASPGMPIIQILNTKNIKIVADVQENFLKSIQKGDSASIFFPALNIQLEETITMIGRTIDLTNRTFKIEIDTKSNNGKLKPNLLAVITFKDFEVDDVITIPLDVVQEEVTGKKFVYVVKEEDSKLIARKSYIEIGESTINTIIVTKGISLGDRLITKGTKDISDGDLIKLNA